MTALIGCVKIQVVPPFQSLRFVSNFFFKKIESWQKFHFLVAFFFKYDVTYFKNLN